MDAMMYVVRRLLRREPAPEACGTTICSIGWPW